MTKRRHNRDPRVLALGILLALGGFAGGQSIFSSSIAGIVRDPMGAGVVGAEVIVKNLANDKIDKAVSNAAGAYRIEGLIPGSYEVTTAKYGFRTSKIRLLMDARRQLHADVKLSLAGVDENTENAPPSKTPEDGGC